MASDIRQRRLDALDFAALSERILGKDVAFKFVAEGGSMSPYVQGGDVVSVAPLGVELAVGTVILCRHGSRVFLHRVCAVQRDDAGRMEAVRVAGDAQPGSREEVAVEIRPEDVLGVLIDVTPGQARSRSLWERAIGRLARLWRGVGLLLAIAVTASSGTARAASTFDVGSFTKVTTGAPVNQTVNHTLGVVPKAIILWTAGNTNVTGFQNGFELAVGISDTTTSRSFSTSSADGAGTSSNNRRVAAVMLTIINSAGTTVAEANLNAVSATTFQLRWTTNDANAYVIHYLVVGGTDIQAKVGAFTMATATGNQAITGVGFRPDLYLLVHGGSGLTGAAPTTSGNSGLGFGYADASGDQWAFSMLGIDNSGTSDTYRSQRAGQSLTADTSDGGGTFSKLASWVSMNAGGFTLNYSTANANAGQVAYLALKGLNVHAGSFNKRNGGGTQAIAGLGFQPKALFLASFQDVTSANPIANARMGLGMGDGTSEASLAFSDTDALATTNVASISKTDKVFIKSNVDPPTIQAEADLQSMDVGGFTLNWSTGDAAATQMLFLAMGSLAPTVAELDGFEAVSGPGGVQLGWRTRYELDHLGFRLFREEGGQRVPLGPDLFPGAVLRAGSGTALTGGAGYGWVDRRGKAGSRYWLQASHLDGSSDWHGPITAQSGSGALARLGSRTGALTVGPELPPAISQVLWTGAHAPGDASVAAHLAEGGHPALKIGVAANGVYRLTGAEVRAALGAGVRPHRLHLSHDGHTVPLSVQGGEDGTLDDADSVTFFGLALDGTHTDTRWYWLTEGNGLALAQGGGSAAATTSELDEVVELRGHSIYFPALRAAGDEPPFFTAAITAAGTTRSLEASPLAVAGRSASLELDLQGVSQGSHAVEVSVGGSVVANLSFDGAVPHRETITLAPGQWAGGPIALGLRSGGATDISFLKVARLRYARTVGSDEAVAGTVAGPSRLLVSGADASSLRALDITDADAPALLPVTAGEEGAEIQVAAGGARFVYVYRDEDLHTGAPTQRLERGPVAPDVQGAQWLAVAPRAFLAALEPLEALRRAEGWRTARVAVEDIYDAYAFGAKDPEGLRRFFRAAWESGGRQTRHVLLVGDASFDPRGFLGTGKPDLLPASQASTDYLRTAVEDTWVDFNGDGRPEWPVGRLPARDVQDVEAMVQKLLAPWADASAAKVEWAVGRPEGFDFEKLLVEDGGGGVARQMTVWNAESAPQTPEAVFASWSQARPKVVGYLGHGSVATWSSGLLSSDQVAERAQSVRAPLLLSLSCLAGSFDDAFSDSLAESWVRLPSGGAQAAIAFSGLAPPHDQILASDAILSAALEKGKTLGESLLAAKASVSSDDVRRTLLLLGDPAQRLTAPPPEETPGPQGKPGCGGGMGVLTLWLALGFLFFKTSQRSS